MSKRIGTPTETGIARYLQVNGFPHAERRPLSGALDKGDILVCPGVIIEAKSGKAAENASDGQILKWLEETERERQNAFAAIALLVTKRRGVSNNRAGEFWCHMDGGVFADLVYEVPKGEVPYEKLDIPIRVHLANAVYLLRLAGYGDPLPDE